MKIWIVRWHTESGDEGIYGYWKREPSDIEIEQLLKKRHPDEFCSWCNIHEDCPEDCSGREPRVLIYFSIKALEPIEV